MAAVMDSSPYTVGDEEAVFHLGVVPFCWTGDDLVTYVNGKSISIYCFLSWHEEARQKVRGWLLQRACEKWIA